jgi:hypothetical protein
MPNSLLSFKIEDTRAHISMIRRISSNRITGRRLPNDFSPLGQDEFFRLLRFTAA